MMRHIDPGLRLFAGEGSLAALDKELSRAGCQRAVILCGRSMAADPALDSIRQAIGARLAGVCVGVKANSPRSAVEALAEQVGGLKADAVIAVGGGSAMVTARAVAIALAEGKPLDQLATQRDTKGKMFSPRLDAPKLPIFALPTTPTTATVKPGTAIHDEESGARLALFDPKTRPAAIFLDPALLRTAPPGLVQSAALNTLCSAVEGLLSGSDDPFALAALSRALRLCAQGLPVAGHGTVDLALAAILCGRGTDHTGMGLATVISHAIAKACGVDGGIAKAAALPHVLRFNWEFVGPGREELGFALGCPDDQIAETLRRLCQSLDVPDRLRDLGLTQEAIPGIAGHCMGDWFIRTNPRPVQAVEDLEGLLREAW